MRTSLLTIVMLANLTWAHGQCTIAAVESEDKTKLFQRTWGAKIENDKKVMEINIVRVDTVDTKDKPTFYLTVVVDSLGNKTINRIDQLTLRMEDHKEIVEQFTKL